MNENDRELLDQLEVQASWLGVETPPRPEVDQSTTDGARLQSAGTSSMSFTRRAIRR